MKNTYDIMNILWYVHAYQDNAYDRLCINVYISLNYQYQVHHTDPRSGGQTNLRKV